MSQKLGMTERMRRSLLSLLAYLGGSIPPSSESAASQPGLNLVVALSGGADSMVLLDAASSLLGLHIRNLTAVHVHHGLSPNADTWAAFCKKEAEGRGVHFVLKKVSVDRSLGIGVEAAARKARYEAFDEVFKETGAQAVLVAHHLDDQLETFLIQWMRGAGPEGLSAMPEDGANPLGSARILRPFLNFTRKDILTYANERGLNWVEDESNQDTGYLRNALRLKVIPVLEEIRPGFKQAALRSIELIAESSELLKEEDSKLLKDAEDEKGRLITSKAFSLGNAASGRILRAWLKKRGFPSLSRVQLNEVLRQVTESEHKEIVLFKKKGLELCFFSGLLFVEREGKLKEGASFPFKWSGEEIIDLPQFGGRLKFYLSEKGFPERFLRSGEFTVQTGYKGLKLKTHSKRPTKLVGDLYKEAGVPEFERRRLPMVLKGRALLYAPLLGEDVRSKREESGPRYSIVFEKTS